MQSTCFRIEHGERITKEYYTIKKFFFVNVGKSYATLVLVGLFLFAHEPQIMLSFYTTFCFDLFLLFYLGLSLSDDDFGLGRHEIIFSRWEIILEHRHYHALNRKPEQSKKKEILRL